MVNLKTNGVQAGSNTFVVDGGAGRVEGGTPASGATHVGDAQAAQARQELLAAARQGLDISVEQLTAALLIPPASSGRETAFSRALRSADPEQTAALIRTVAASLRGSSVQLVQDLLRSVKSAA